MLTNLVLLLGAASTLVSAGTPAPVTSGNDPNVKYRATLPKKASTPITGAISGHASNNGSGIIFNVRWEDLPVDGGPYSYHIHEKPVPADGNCTGTGPHLDYYGAGDLIICDQKAPETCQTGDLSGKFGKPLNGNFSTKYRDPYSSSVPGTPAFFGNRSVVVHNKDKVRLTCANFTLVQEEATGNATGNSSSTYSATGLLPTATTSAGPKATATGALIVAGAASSYGASVAAIVLGGLALVL